MSTRKLINARGLVGVQFLAQSSNPATPLSGYGRLFLKTDGKLYLLDSAGTASSLLYASGLSGGQTLAGGTDSGDDLTLQSTSHATKGYILLEDITGINQSSPSAQLHITSGSASRVGLRVDSAASPSADIVQATIAGTNVFRVDMSGGLISVYQSALTNTAATVLNMSHLTSGTPAAGFGVQMQWSAETTVQNRALAAFVGQWVSATDATRTGRIALKAYDFSGLREGLQIVANGTAIAIGFLGQTAVIQQTAGGVTAGFTAGVGTGVNDDSTFTGNTGASAYTIGDLVLALKNYGLIAT